MYSSFRSDLESPPIPTDHTIYLSDPKGSSDILGWTVLSIQTRPESNQVQMFQRFLAQVIMVHELFVESQDGIGFLQGDRMPSTTYCTGLNGKPLHSLGFH